MSDHLTPSESAILIVLMAEAREITNTELLSRWGLDVRKPSRDKLNDLKLVESTPKPWSHQLADKGWSHVNGDLNFDSPRARALGAALATLHSNLRDRVLPRTGLANFGEMFTHSGGEVGVGDTVPVSLEPRLRSTYAALAAEPGGWVALVRLRPFFADVPTADLDEALRALSRYDDVNLVPESNQKVLTEADRAAAVHLGGRDKHYLAIGV